MDRPERKKSTAEKVAAVAANSSLRAKEETDLALAKEVDKSSERLDAEASLSSFFVNATTSREFSLSNFAGLDLAQVGIVLREKIEQVQAGDLSEVEAILMGQASCHSPYCVVSTVYWRRPKPPCWQNSRPRRPPA